MPTPEANASSFSSSLTIRNASITELAIEEADSFKANVSTMTQDQCLDNGHETKSNNRSSSDKVSDDLNNSINSVVSNGVNSVVQEFNVDVNREYSTDLLIVQNRTAVDTDSPPTGKVLSTSKQLTETPSNFVDSRGILENSINNIEANKSECEQNIVADMTVITHQNSSENIRDIIANSERANKNSSDSQPDRFEKSANSDINHINPRSANKSTGIRKNRKLIRSGNVNESEDVQIEDPIERLNKLRASISSALSEVKGVLKQYSTEQSCDEQNESAPSKQPPDDGPVRFRFVRKIRRRSVFSEDDETEIAKPSTDVTTSPIIENKVIEEVPNELQDIKKALSNENQDFADQNKVENAVPTHLEEIKKSIVEETDQIDTKLIQTAIDIASDSQVLKDKSDIDKDNAKVSEIQKTTKDYSLVGDVEVPRSTSETTKSKNGKTKKVLKKDRRASIAAVEINQISKDESPIALELKTQRRPSDSGTLVKQTTRIKAKTSEKQKSTSNRKAKTVSSSKAQSSTIKPSQTSKTVEKTDSSLGPPEEQTSPSTVDTTNTVIEKPVIETKPTGPDVSKESTQKMTSYSAAIVKSKTHEEKFDPAIADLFPTILTKAGTNVPKLNTPAAVAPAPTAVSLTVNGDVPQTSPKVTEVIKSEATLAVKLNRPEVAPAPVVSSSVNADVSQTSPEQVEVNKSEAACTIKLNTPEVAPAPAVSSTVNADIPQSVPSAIEVKSNKLEDAQTSAVDTKTTDALNQSAPEKSVPSVKPKKSEAQIQAQQSRKTGTEPTKAGLPNLQTKSKTSQSSKTGSPAKKPNTPASQTNILEPSHATAKVESSKSVINATACLENITVSPLPIETNKQTKTNMSTEVGHIEPSKAAPGKSLKTMQVAEKIVTKKKPTESVVSSVAKQIPKQNSTTETSKIAAESFNQIDKKISDTQESRAEDTSSIESEVPKPANVPKDALAVKFNLPGQESVEELQRLEEQQQDTETSPPETSETTETTEATVAPPKKKRKAKRKVIIRRIKRKLSKDDTFLLPQEAASELEICEKEIEEKDLEEEPEEQVPDGPKEPKSCLKKRQYEIGDVVMYAEHYKKTQVRWKKAIVTERITSISYKLNIEGEERPAHISYIKKFTDRKVNFGGKEYLEIDYAQIEENEEKERNYSIWNLV